MPVTTPLPWSLRVLRRLPLPHKLGLLERCYGKRLAREGICWVVCANGVAWKLDLADACQRWMVYGDYEGGLMLNWLRRWLANGGVVVDSGANIGQMLLYLAPLADVSVFAFEPLPAACRWLRECLAVQQGWQVTVIEAGLAEQEKTLALQCDGARSTTRLDWYQGRRLEKIDIPMATLDAAMRNYGVNSIRLWKLDVEGGEYDALCGAEGYLQSKAIAAVLIETHPANFHRIRAYLAAFGYKLFLLQANGCLSEAEQAPQVTMNYLALPD